MRPVLLRIGSFSIHTYGFLMVLAWAAAMILLLHQGKKSGLRQEILLRFSFWVILPAVIGARGLYVVENLDWFLGHPREILFLWRGGLSFYGGLLFAVISAVYYTYRHRLSFWRIANIASPSIALGVSIGRIGCFFNGCCYGKPWKWGLVFPVGSPAGRAFPHQPIIPTQLISSVDLLAIFLVLILLGRQDRRRSQLFPFFLLLYSLHRFGIEFLRADHLPVFLHLTAAQFASMFLGILALIMLWGKARLSKGALR